MWRAKAWDPILAGTTGRSTCSLEVGARYEVAAITLHFYRQGTELPTLLSRLVGTTFLLTLINL
jgi:hypothetical protein